MPSTALHIAALAKEAGFPQGVLNIGPDFGPTAGQPKNIELALEVTARLDAGQVYVNQYLIGGVQVPFGGFKQSGIHREFGLEGQYYEVKAVIVDMPVKI